MAPVASPASIQETKPDLSQADSVAGLFRDVFDVDTVTLDDDFFRLGGDSLIAETLILQIERTFGVDLSISTLIEASTPRKLAAVIAEASGPQTRSLLVTVRADGSDVPLVCVHGIDGESMFPERLAKVLPGDNPIFGLRALGLETGELPMTDIEAIAANYLKVLDKRLPGGFALLGHCGGATIALEMVRQMLAAGRMGPSLILIDPEVDNAPHLTFSGLRLKATRWNIGKRLGRISRTFEAEPGMDVAMRRKLVRKALVLTVAHHLPEPLPYPALFVYTKKRKETLLHPERGYQIVLPQAELVELDVDHLRMFSTGLPDVTRLVRDYLDRTAATA